ncbi:MAG: sodium:proton antiporter [Rickettsiales bacterium]|jgi:CPA2 family monovalent cation:H+ antiporter-2|nr:sodium:proton antiporter [Rickettsiales bacterium]
MSIPHELPLITTITLGFTVAFVCGIIASKLRLSPIVGYLVAGIIIGPYTPGVVADGKIAEELSEIGVLLLMFGVGLHFSIKDLMEVKRIAIPGAIVQIAAATVLGAFASSFWGWSLASGLTLGLALSVASTVVLLRALEEHNLLQSTNGNIVIGWLIVEDIVMVLALVLIPAMAGTDDGVASNGVLSTLAFAVGKVVLFITCMMVVGKRVLPWLLAMVARMRSRELFTLTVFAVAMGVAFSATKLFGVSFALGAFFAGMMIRESDLSQEAAEKALPLQDAFAVLFFVSVGMLFNPQILIDEPFRVLVVVAIILVGKSIAATAIVLLFRYPLKSALLVSAGLAQIGEFSFILANLGVAYNLLPETGRDLILAGALISILFNPAFFLISRQIYEWAAQHSQLASWLNIGIGGDDLAHLRKEEKQNLKELVILVGHGRVGKHISENIHSAHIELVVIDANRERIEVLREKGFHAIAGDASHEETLQEAAIDKAIAVVVAVPNPFEARKVVETARKLKPGIKVIVRAHNEEEEHYFVHQDVDLAVMGPREIGRRIVEYLNGCYGKGTKHIAKKNKSH